MGVQVLAHPSAMSPRRPLRHSCTFVLLEHMCSDELVALLDRLLDEGSSCGCLTECHCHARSDLLTVGHAACVVPVHGDVLELSAILSETARLEVLLLNVTPSHLRQLVLPQFSLGRKLVVNRLWHVGLTKCPRRGHHLVCSAVPARALLDAEPYPSAPAPRAGAHAVFLGAPFVPADFPEGQ